MENDTISTLDYDSYFDGSLLQLVCWSIIGFAMVVCSFGILYPWTLCLVYGWETNHTVINGRRLKFTGNPVSLFANFIKWWLLTVITLGIYGFWLGIAIKKWKAKNTTFVG